MAAQELQWTTLDDFRPGIFQKITPKTPPGAAVEDGTYGCKSNNTGDLIPGPYAEVGHLTLDADLGTDPGGGLYFLSGITCVNPVFDDDTAVGVDQNNTQVFVAFDYIDLPNDRHLELWRWFTNSTFAVEQVYDETDVFPYDDDFRASRATWALTRSNAADPTQSGSSVLVICQGDGILKSFPDEATPTVTSTDDLPAPAPGNPLPDIILGHQGRIVVFPLSLQGFGTDVVWAHNELMYWLTVNDVTSLDAALGGDFFNVVFGYENPAGYDCGASMSANQLILLKRYGGALMLEGDLNQPRAVNLPGVMSPGFALSWGVQTPLGFFYVVDHGQVYSWTGGDKSENMAPMMNDDFWRPVRDVEVASTYDSPNQRYRSTTALCLYSDLVCVPNNWYMDLTNAPAVESGGGGWWRLADPEALSGSYRSRHSFYAADWTGRWLYAAPFAVEHGGDLYVADRYDRTKGATSYSWKSAPLRQSMERRTEVRQIVIIASGFGTIDGTVFGLEDTGTEVSDILDGIELNTQYPVAFRRNVDVTGNLIQILVEASGGEIDEETGERGPAPTIHEIRFGTQERRRLGVQQGVPEVEP